MKFGYTIIYVADVAATVVFYETAFGLTRRFIHESGQYAEMETGATALAFAANEMAKHHGFRIRTNSQGDLPAGFEVCLVSATPGKAYDRAVAAGAVAVKPVSTMPWGQEVGYVRDLNGCLVELCSPMSAA